MPGFSLRNPHAVIVGALLTVILGVAAFLGMPVDVFPNLDIPVAVVATFYPGMPPMDMEADITTRFERFFTLGSDIEKGKMTLPMIHFMRTALIAPG